VLSEIMPVYSLIFINDSKENRFVVGVSINFEICGVIVSVTTNFSAAELMIN
jgi:hypothetical protein